MKTNRHQFKDSRKKVPPRDKQQENKFVSKKCRGLFFSSFITASTSILLGSFCSISSSLFFVCVIAYCYSRCCTGIKLSNLFSASFSSDVDVIPGQNLSRCPGIKLSNLFSRSLLHTSMSFRGKLSRCLELKLHFDSDESASSSSPCCFLCLSWDSFLK